MKNQPNKATVKDGLPSPKELPIPKPIGDFILGKEYGMCPNGALYHYSDVCELLQAYSDQQNAELRERLTKLQYDLKFEKDVADDALKTQEEELIALRDQISDLDRENNNYRLVYDSVVKNRDDLREMVKELQAKIASYESSIDGLKKVVDSLHNLKS